MPPYIYTLDKRKVMLTNQKYTRESVPMSNLIFTDGLIGCLTTLDVTPVIAGDSYEANLTGAFKLAAMRRPLTLDTRLDMFAFYVPHRHIYGDDWVDFLKAGVGAPNNETRLTTKRSITGQSATALALALSGSSSDTYDVPLWRHNGYLNIYNNYFKRPEAADVSSIQEAGNRCAHLKNIWSADLPKETLHNQNVEVTQDQMKLTDLVEQAAAYNIDQKNDFFMQRYRDVVDGFGGKTTADVDQRPTLIARHSQYASGYDVDGTTDTSLGQYVGRVTQNYNFKVPRFFCPEHGAIWIVCVPRFETILSSEANYLDKLATPTYKQLAGNYDVIANQAPLTVAMEDFLWDGVSGGQFNIAYGQWYRYKANYVSPDYVDLQGFPFVDYTPISDESRWYVNPNHYDEIFQTAQLKHWNTQARLNVNVLRTIPETRDSMLSMV